MTCQSSRSTKAAGCWGPQRFALAPWLRPEAKSERALGPRATSASLERGSPDLPACGPRRGSTSGPVRPIFTSKQSRPSRGAKPHEADDAKTPKGIGLPKMAHKGRKVPCKVHLTRLS